MLSKNEATPLVTLNLLYFVIFLSIYIGSDKVSVYNTYSFEINSQTVLYFINIHLLADGYVKLIATMII